MNDPLRDADAVATDPPPTPPSDGPPLEAPRSWTRTALRAGFAAAIGGFVAFWFHGTPKPDAVTLWFAEPQGVYVVPVTTHAVLPKRDDPVAWAQAVVQKLRQPPRAGLVSVLSADDRLVTVGFAAPRWTMRVAMGSSTGSTTERLLAAGLVQTFVGATPGAKQVELRLADKQDRPLESQHLDLGAPLAPKDVANRGDDSPPGAVETTVWWPLADGSALVPVVVALPAKGLGIPPGDALGVLTRGPAGVAKTVLRPLLPAGTGAQWKGLDGNTAIVELRGGAWPEGPAVERVLDAIVLTLTEFPDVHAVKFHGGSPGPASHLGRYALDAPASRPADINVVPDRAPQPSS